jgi:hypothetical protein
MFEKIKTLVDKILELPGTQAEKEEAWLGINLLLILNCRVEEVGEIKKFHNYLWNNGIKLQCFAPENND